MKKIIHYLFGKPFKMQDTFISKYFRVAYWGMFVFYLFIMSLFILNTIYYPNGIIGLIIVAIFFPVVFRLTYSLVGKANGWEKEA